MAFRQAPPPPRDTAAAGRRRFLRDALASAGGWMTAGAFAAYGDPPAPPEAPAPPAAPASAPPDEAPPPAAAAPPGDETRLALLLGNRAYPEPFDLPPIPKNVNDLRAALERRGFAVSDAIDTDLAATRQVLDGFVERVRRAPPDATVFFYFSGHGVQVDTANLLLCAGANPSARGEVIARSSVQLLQDVVDRLPRRPQGITIAVVDACRTSLRPGAEASEGLNQVEAPPGCLIAFSTGAGRPAIAPAVETQNTFYTASLVKVMGSVSDETSFSDLFRLVKADVQEVMTTHPLAAIRRLAQFPFIAENTRTSVTLAPRSVLRTAQRKRFGGVDEETDWRRLEKALWPGEVVQLADAYLSAYPDSQLAASAKVARDGAREAASTLQRNDVRLFRSAFAPRDDLTDDERLDLQRAGRGDKDAAARIGRRWLGEGGSAPAGTALARYEGWMQYAAALGNGIAAYDLALHYRRLDQPLPASRYEARARELGYTPPPTLDNVRK